MFLRCFRGVSLTVSLRFRFELFFTIPPDFPTGICSKDFQAISFRVSTGAVPGISTKIHPRNLSGGFLTILPRVPQGTSTGVRPVISSRISGIHIGVFPGIYLKDLRCISLEVSTELRFLIRVSLGTYRRRFFLVLFPGCLSEFFSTYPAFSAEISCEASF